MLLFNIFTPGILILIHLVLRFFLGNNNPVGNGLLGFLGGFGAAAVTHSVLGNPCG